MSPPMIKIIGGLLLLALGGIVSTSGLNKRNGFHQLPYITPSLKKVWKRIIFKPNVLIMIGAALFIAGGYMTTKGWNEKSNVSRKNNIIRSVVQEWKMNINIITDEKFAEPNEEKLSEYVAFPRMQISVVAGALSSGYFTDKSDPNFWNKGLALTEQVAYFNNALSISENEMLTPASHVIFSVRKQIRDGELRKSMMEKLLLFGIMLNEKYSDMLSKEFGEEFLPIEEIDEMKKQIKMSKNHQKPKQ